ncbi:MAG: DUF1553 domain-containing protein [Isosphaeraceae bacterium]|nr:DUF1553 domain-containing protein [Isosphaeraceae bacterium]
MRHFVGIVALFAPGWVFSGEVAVGAGGEPARVEIVEGLPEKWTWETAIPTDATESHPGAGTALIRLPTRYDGRGIEVDRKGPILVRVSTTAEPKAGTYRLILRSRSAARLVVDGKVKAETKPISRNSSGHEPVPPENPLRFAGEHRLPSGSQERVVEWTADGARHEFEIRAIVGGKGLRNETGEIVAALEGSDGVPRIIGAVGDLTEAGWADFVERESLRLAADDTARRTQAAASEGDYWKRRHEIARRIALEDAGRSRSEGGNPIDRRLGPDGFAPVDDAAFLRRLWLDATGVIPDAGEVAAFLADRSPDKRKAAIDRVLADPRWADSWMGYWQDVLAENPGLLKPTLNNTGPFRRFLHAAMLDNLPIDRFVTDLVRMDGSRLGGGPAGFAMATQNDAPMAAKAQVLAKAFLAADLKCARCHDAPFHPYGQEDLFGLAALLSNGPQKIPATSTVTKRPGGRTPRVSVTIEAGESVAPEWNLTEITPDVLPEGILPPKATKRERFAALVTSPTNSRFARVVANRVWHRYLGRGLIEPIDDWDGDVVSHDSALLDDLARELIARDYDLKALARVIFESRAYQSKVVEGDSRPGARAARRRMSAEQVLDSMFAAAGKPFRAEELCLDIDGRRPPTEFLNLGRPERAWQLALPSNERDRPALTLPVVSSLTDVLTTFGWRAARPDALTIREDGITALQPATIANAAVVDGRIARLSDDSAFTKLCLEAASAEALADAVTLRILSRPATLEEKARLVEHLGATFGSRLIAGAKPNGPMRASSRRVSWSNHLHPEATTLQQDEERIVREGDPPSARLTPEFRERMEEVVWSLVNSPEFVFIP